MCAWAIKCDGVSKRYELDAVTGPGRLAEDVVALFKRRRRAKTDPDSMRTLWALSDVTFELEAGDVLGLIGRNGSGKSTLLKIFSRVTKPTVGEAVIRGSLSSLLEVGTGFHPELTGRENVFLNGTILGMRRRQIEESFDEIVEFAGVERFLETPVKRYSSGMYTRLAFSVAAHLSSDVLLVDEVLAVGDHAFQQKCIGKMADAARGGKTVIFVSHNLGSITQLCDRGMWLDDGRVRCLGSATEVVERYLTEGASDAPAATFPIKPTSDAQVTAAGFANDSGQAATEVSAEAAFHVDMDVVVRKPITGISTAVWLRNQSGVVALSSDISHADPRASESLKVGTHSLRLTVPARLLAPGRYTLTVGILSPYEGIVDRHDDFCAVTVVDHSTRTGSTRAGIIGLNLPWSRRGDDSSGRAPDVG